MELGNFGKHTILTGAGWSQNWGARLAADVWQLLMDNPAIAQRDRLRALLLEEDSFEAALAKVQNPPFTTDDLERFERALIEAFVSMDRAMTPDDFLSIPFTNRVQELLFRFAGRRDQGVDTGYLFTLNQDLFFERYLFNDHVYNAPAPSLPGIRITPGVSIFNSLTGPYSEQFIMCPITDTAVQSNLRGQTNVIKLHGSFNWRTPDARSLMVVGTEKTRQIAGVPLLAWYSDVLKAVLFSGDVRLMIVGYGFGDEYINATIAEAIESYGLKVFIWGRGSNLKDRILAAPHGSAIWKGLLSTVTQPMREVFPPSQEISEEYQRIRRVFVNDQTIW